MPTARSAFTIARVGKYLYMCGDSNNIDVFDTENFTFIDLSLSIPEIESYSTLIACGNHLLLFQNESCYKIDMISKEASVLLRIPKGQWWSVFAPIECKDNLFFTRYDDFGLYRYDIQNNTLSKELTFL